VSLAPLAFVARLPSRLRRAVSLLFALGVVHATLSLQLIPVIGLMAFVHAVFPPMSAWAAVELASRTPLFALMVYGSGAMLAWVLWTATQPLRARLPRPLRWTLVASLTLWAVVGCGEGVRAALMETQLMGDATACHETRSLMASLRQRYAFEFDGDRRPHGWRVRGDEVALWSYHTLRFEQAPTWSGADTARAQCQSGQRAGAYR